MPRKRRYVTRKQQLDEFPYSRARRGRQNNIYRIVMFVETDEGSDWVREELTHALRGILGARISIDDMENL